LIAVIDDDEQFRVAVVELLSSTRFAARGFASAEEFVATDDVDRYDCIITDINMPGMKGIELLRSLRSRNLDTPVILVTAQIDPTLEASLQSLGAIRSLTKPFGPDALTACLEKILNDRGLS